MSNNKISKNKRKKQARKQAQKKQAIPQEKSLTKLANRNISNENNQLKQAKKIEKISEENKRRNQISSSSKNNSTGKNRRKKEMKKQAIEQIKRLQPTDADHKERTPNNVHIFLVNRTSYFNLFNASNRVGGRCLYEIIDAENSDYYTNDGMYNGYLSIISIYNKLKTIGATNFLLCPRIEYALYGVGKIKIEKVEDLESRIEIIKDDRNVYNRLEFQMEGCTGYVNTKFYTKNMILESRTNDNYKSTKQRY